MKPVAAALGMYSEPRSKSVSNAQQEHAVSWGQPPRAAGVVWLSSGRGCGPHTLPRGMRTGLQTLLWSKPATRRACGSCDMYCARSPPLAYSVTMARYRGVRNTSCTHQGCRMMLADLCCLRSRYLHSQAEGHAILPADDEHHMNVCWIYQLPEGSSSMPGGGGRATQGILLSPREGASG